MALLRKQLEGSNRHNVLGYPMHRQRKRRREKDNNQDFNRENSGQRSRRSLRREIDENMGRWFVEEEEKRREMSREITTRESLLLLTVGKHKRRS